MHWRKVLNMDIVEEIFSNLYKIEIPLPDSPLHALNSYVVKGKNRNLIIDTGLNREKCKLAMDKALQMLNLDLTKTDIFLTHFHPDHSGLISYLASPNSTVFVSLADILILQKIIDSQGEGYWPGYINYAEANGFAEAGLVVSSHPDLSCLGSADSTDFNWAVIKNGDVINIDDYILECLPTPGHTMGHFSLLEKRHKILFAGDHIMKDTIPNIEFYSDEINPLGDYLMSLQRIKDLDIDVILPGHGSRINNPKQRIDELIQYHQRRDEAMLNFLESLSPHGASAYQIASIMYDYAASEKWNQFLLEQKWFVTGECIAHLRNLYQKGLLTRTNEQGIIEYSIV